MLAIGLFGFGIASGILACDDGVIGGVSAGDGTDATNGTAGTDPCGHGNHSAPDTGNGSHMREMMRHRPHGGNGCGPGPGINGTADNASPPQPPRRHHEGGPIAGPGVNGTANATQVWQAIMALDLDGDGIADLQDPDDDGDGINDTQDLFPHDHDNDGLPDAIDPDDDNDGVLDADDADYVASADAAWFWMGHGMARSGGGHKRGA